MSVKENKITYTRLKGLDSDLWVVATKKGICYIGSESHTKTWLKNKNVEENKESMEPYITELVEYINGERKIFDLPLDVKGTDFQKAVWKNLQEIPYGETRSYTEIAENIGKPEAVRAVASAIGKNPVLFVIPCHRVIRKNGKLSGFREGVQMKERLLELD